MAERATFRTPLQWLKFQFGAQGAPPGGERRINPRKRLRFDAEIRNMDSITPVVGMDIHEDGARILAKRKWETGTVLFMKIPSVQLGGFAEVRHCTLRKDGRYSIGLAFRGPFVPQGSEWQVQRYFQPSSNAWTTQDDAPPVSDDDLPPTRRKPREVA